MKSEKEIRDRIEDIDKAIKDLLNRENHKEIANLTLKIETLEWVLDEE